MNTERRKRRVKVRSEHSHIDANSDSKSLVSLNSHKKSKKYKPRQRQENSLGELTKKVINFIKKHGEKEIHISSIVTALEVKKRRIYDITNVLEGNQSIIFIIFVNMGN